MELPAESVSSLGLLSSPRNSSKEEVIENCDATDTDTMHPLLGLVSLLPLIAAMETCTVRVPSGRQCGGVAVCQGGNVLRNQTSAAWTDACCLNANDRCLRVNATFYKCGPSPLSPPADWIKAFLDRHNAYRAKHRAGALVWSASVAGTAQKWVSGCRFQHEDAAGRFGENLYAYSARQSAVDAAKAATDRWYAEIAQYDWSAPGFDMRTAHATCLVWRSTTQLGCGVAYCPSLGTFVSCRYAQQPCNVLGAFQSNVLRPA